MLLVVLYHFPQLLDLLYLSDMKKIIMALMAACLAAPVMADPLGKDDYYTIILWDVCFFKNVLMMYKK